MKDNDWVNVPHVQTDEESIDFCRSSLFYFAIV